jgi:hypothetical protein
MFDFTQHLKLKHQEIAIKGAVKYKLSEILPLLSKNQLSTIASNVGLPGRSKMKKQDYISALPPYILRVDELEMTLQMTRKEEFILYQELLNEPYVQSDDITPGRCFYLMDKGILFSFHHKDKLYFVIPQEIKDAHQKLDWDSLIRTKTHDDLVLDYVMAAVNLYGICKPEQIIDIYNRQNDDTLSITELLKICNFHLERMHRFHWIDGYLASDYFDDDDLEEFNELLMRIQGKPNYIPNKEKLLKYADDLHLEMTPQLLQLRLFILNQLCDDPQLVDSAIDDIQLACSMEEPLQEIVSELERREIHFKTMDQVKRFTALVTEVYNNTRMWSNCGYTPSEMSAIAKTTLTTIPNLKLAHQKVGRNDPCPCGSGQKYKKCCGKG